MHAIENSAWYKMDQSRFGHKKCLTWLELTWNPYNHFWSSQKTAWDYSRFGNQTSYCSKFRTSVVYIIAFIVRNSDIHLVTARFLTIQTACLVINQYNLIKTDIFSVKQFINIKLSFLLFNSSQHQLWVEFKTWKNYPRSRSINKFL